MAARNTNIKGAATTLIKHSMTARYIIYKRQKNIVLCVHTQR